MKNFTCLRISLGLAAMVVSVGYLLLAGIASAQGPVTDAVINREIQNGQERAAMNALTGAPGATAQVPPGEQVGVDIQFPSTLTGLDNVMFVELQSEDVPEANRRFHQAGTWAEQRSIDDSPNHTVGATFLSSKGIQGGHVYDVNIYDAMGNKTQVGRISVGATGSPQVFRFAAAGFDATGATTRGTAEQNADVEAFDFSGLPPQPTNFIEQRLQALLQIYHKGDLNTAAQIQHLLAQDYSTRGDQARAQAAQQREDLARKLARGY